VKFVRGERLKRRVSQAGTGPLGEGLFRSPVRRGQPWKSKGQRRWSVVGSSTGFPHQGEDRRGAPKKGIGLVDETEE